jgi:MarR family transcriptional regulator, organic hydroperoxide resistance regulator
MHKAGTRSVADFNSTIQQWAVMGALSRPAARQHTMNVKEPIAILLAGRQNITAVPNRSSEWSFLNGRE